MSEWKTRLRRALFIARQQPGHVLGLLWFCLLAGLDPQGIGLMHALALVTAVILAVYQTLLDLSLRKRRRQGR